jgi:hypothetical protein
MTALLLAAALTMAPTEAQLLRGIAEVESGTRIHAPDGDLDRPVCRRSVGMYQVRPIAVRELVRVGWLKPMAGYSLTNCAGIRKWLAVPANNRRAAQLYLRLMLAREPDVESALAAYNGGSGCASSTCLRYAGAVLAVASGE